MGSHPHVATHTHSLSSLRRAEMPASKFLITSALITQVHLKHQSRPPLIHIKKTHKSQTSHPPAPEKNMCREEEKRQYLSVLLYDLLFLCMQVLMKVWALCYFTVPLFQSSTAAAVAAAAGFSVASFLHQITIRRDFASCHHK